MKPISVTAISCLVLLTAVLLFAHKSQEKHSASPTSTAGAQLLKQVGTIELPGPKGKRFDYLTIDPSRNLFSQPILAPDSCMQLISRRTK